MERTSATIQELKVCSPMKAPGLFLQGMFHYHSGVVPTIEEWRSSEYEWRRGWLTSYYLENPFIETPATPLTTRIESSHLTQATKKVNHALEV